MARVAAKTVVIVDNTFGGESSRRPSSSATPRTSLLHGRGVAALFERAGLRIERVRSLPQRVEVEPWLARRAATARRRARVASSLADRIEDGWITLDRTRSRE
jgi:hypothetical protein